VSSRDPHYSDDGRWWWDGQAWRSVAPAAPQAGGPPRSHLFLSAGLAVALAGVLTLIAVLAAVDYAVNRGAIGSSSQAGSTQVACASRVLSKADAAVASGDKGCGGSERLGKRLSSVDCSGSAFTASDWQTVPAQGAADMSTVACTLDSPKPGDSADIETIGDQPADVVLVADVVPSTPALVVGMSARCNQDHCVTFGVRSDDQYQMSERKPNDPSFTVLGQGAVNASPTLASSQPSRLVLWLRGNRFEAYLNGRQFGRGVSTGVGTSSGKVLIYLEGLDSTHPAKVKVTSLKLFAAA
jgi:hypothetical protein